eukprot:PLAT364.1.p1 GENE.PLAT364.1~~PLAT364.1.p1  ORF type:complete len:314 (+),score=91.52 PLAT364.1:45-986(+)
MALAPLTEAEWEGVPSFYAHWVDRSKPVVFRRAAAEWRATQRWTPAFFAERAPSLAVTVSISNEETSRTEKKEMRLRDYVDELHEWEATAGEKESAEERAFDDVDGDCESKDADRPVGGAVTASSGDAGQPGPGYIKQFLLASAFPELLADMHLDSFFNWRTRFCTTYFWMGPAGAVTGLHSDDENNVLVCLYGTKQVILFPPEQRELLYVTDKYDSGTECCAVDPEAPDLAAHPRFAEASGHIVQLEAGDVLFIPRGHWHHVRSTSTCISANHFASTLMETIRFGSGRAFVSLLHNLSLYKPGNCVCHAPKP